MVGPTKSPRMSGGVARVPRVHELADRPDHADRLDPLRERWGEGGQRVLDDPVERLGRDPHGGGAVGVELGGLDHQGVGVVVVPRVIGEEGQPFAAPVVPLHGGDGLESCAGLPEVP